MHSASQDSLGSVVTFMSPPSRVDTGFVDPPLLCPAFPMFTTLTLTPRESGIYWIYCHLAKLSWLKLVVDYTDARAKFAEYSIEAPTTAAGVFKVVLLSLNSWRAMGIVDVHGLIVRWHLFVRDVLSIA